MLNILPLNKKNIVIAVRLFLLISFPCCGCFNIPKNFIRFGAGEYINLPICSVLFHVSPDGVKEPKYINK